MHTYIKELKSFRNYCYTRQVFTHMYACECVRRKSIIAGRIAFEWNAFNHCTHTHTHSTAIWQIFYICICICIGMLIVHTYTCQSALRGSMRESEFMQILFKKKYSFFLCCVTEAKKNVGKLFS